jgi:hypothetical protein
MSTDSNTPVAEETKEPTRRGSFFTPLAGLASKATTLVSAGVATVTTGVSAGVGKVSTGVSAGVGKVTTGVSAGVATVTTGVSAGVASVTTGVSAGVATVSTGVSASVGKVTTGVTSGVSSISTQAKSALDQAGKLVVGSTGRSTEASLEYATDLMLACVRRTEARMREDGMAGSVECEISVGFPFGCYFTSSVTVDLDEKKVGTIVDDSTTKEGKIISTVIDSALTGIAIHSCRLLESGVAPTDTVKCAVSGNVVWAKISVRITSTVDAVTKSATGLRKTAEKAAAKAEEEAKKAQQAAAEEAAAKATEAAKETEPEKETAE